jgi:hypothetical protein
MPGSKLALGAIVDKKLIGTSTAEFSTALVGKAIHIQLF